MSPTPSAKTEKPDMAARIAAEKEANPLAHEWVVAANVPVDTKTARRASFRGSFRTEAGMRVEALETMCSACRRPMDEVADEDCAAKVNNEHLIGGNPGERAKRKVSKPQGVIHRQVIDRRGMNGYSVHSGR